MTTGDYTNEYSLDKHAMIYIASKKNMVFFKPFLEDLTFQREQKVQTKTDFYSKKHKVEGIMDSRKLTFKVVASDQPEAIENHKKFQKLIRIILPDTSNNRSSFSVKFSNLIHGLKTTNNSYSTKRSYTYQEVIDNGYECQCSGIEYKPEMDLGFFDLNGLFFAKAFTINLDLSLAVAEFRKKNATEISSATISGVDNAFYSPGGQFGYPVPWSTKKQ